MQNGRRALGWLVLSVLWAGWATAQTVAPTKAATAPEVAPALADIRARVQAAGDAAKHDADAVVVLDETIVLVRPTGIGSARRHNVTKVLREPAIRSLSVRAFDFDPSTNRLELEAVRVYRVDGNVEEIPLTTKVLQPQPASGVFWGTQQYLVSVPNLAVGDAVETISTMTGFNVAYLGAGGGATTVSRGGAAGVAAPATGAGQPATEPQLNAKGEPLQPPVPGHWHDEALFFTTGYPILEKRYTVRLPKDKPLQYGVYNGELRTLVTFDGDELVYTFERKDIKPLKGETNMEPWPNLAPKLLLATLPSWEDKARWLYQVSEPQFTPDDAIRAKVAEVIKNCKTDEEKYTALNHWVAENIRYAGTSRGMCEGYTIHDIKETFHDRAGVCKDKAGMLVGMLRVAGFDSFLVMTMARQRVDAIPADQFNHAVTCIRNRDGSLILLDPTWMPKSRDNWSTLEPLQHVVYGLPEGKELSQSPYFPPETSLAQWGAQTKIAEDGTVTGHVTWTATGTPEGRVRRILAAHPPTERDNYFVEAFQRLSPTVELTNLKCLDPDDFSRPLDLAADYTAGGFVVGDGARRYLALPMMQTPLGATALKDLFGNTEPKERKYGLKLWATRLAKIDETVELPQGWEVVDAPQPVEIDGPAAGLKFTFERAPQAAAGGASELHYTCVLTIKKWIVPPDEYANFKQVMEKFEELAGRVVVCTVKGGGAAATAGDKAPAKSDKIPAPQTPAAKSVAQAPTKHAAPAQPTADVTPDAVIELWEQRWKLQDDGALVYHEKKHVRLNSERAYGEFADPRITYNADTDKLEIIAAHTKLPNGQYVELPAYAHIEVAPDATAGWPAFAGIRQHLLVMSGLEPGCVVELEYRITSKPGTRPLAADLRLDHQYPVQKRIVQVETPTNIKVRAIIANLPEDQKLPAETQAWVDQVQANAADGSAELPGPALDFGAFPGTPDEPQGLPWQTGAARFAFAVAQTDKPWERAEPRFAALTAAADTSPLIDRLAQEWTRDARTPEEKLDTLQQKLAAQFTIVDMPTAWRPITLRPASAVAQSNYGLPSEAAALLMSLARSAGVETRPLLIVPEDCPDVVLQESMIETAALTLLSQPMRADEGDPELDFDDLQIWEPRHGRVRADGTWAGMRMVLDPQLTEYGQDAWDDATASNLEIRGKVKLSDDGMYAGKLNVNLSGLFVSSQALRAADAQRARLTALVGRVLPGVTVEGYTTRRLATGEFEAEVQAKSAKPLKKLDGAWLLQLPKDGPFLADVPLPLADASRRTPVRLAGAFDERIDVTIEYPEKWTLLAQPQTLSPADADSDAPDWGTVEQTVTVANGSVKLVRQTRVENRDLAPDDFAALRGPLNALRTDAARTVIVKP